MKMEMKTTLVDGVVFGPEVRRKLKSSKRGKPTQR